MGNGRLRRVVGIQPDLTSLRNGLAMYAHVTAPQSLRCSNRRIRASSYSYVFLHNLTLIKYP